MKRKNFTVHFLLRRFIICFVKRNVFLPIDARKITKRNELHIRNYCALSISVKVIRLQNSF